MEAYQMHIHSLIYISDLSSLPFLRPQFNYRSHYQPQPTFTVYLGYLRMVDYYANILHSVCTLQVHLVYWVDLSEKCWTKFMMRHFDKGILKTKMTFVKSPMGLLRVFAIILIYWKRRGYNVLVQFFS